MALPQDNKADDVEGLFDRARQAGAVDGTQQDLRGPGGNGGAGDGAEEKLSALPLLYCWLRHARRAPWTASNTCASLTAAVA